MSDWLGIAKILALFVAVELLDAVVHLFRRRPQNL